MLLDNQTEAGYIHASVLHEFDMNKLHMVCLTPGLDASVIEQQTGVCCLQSSRTSDLTRLYVIRL